MGNCLKTYEAYLTEEQAYILAKEYGHKWPIRRPGKSTVKRYGELTVTIRRKTNEELYRLECMVPDLIIRDLSFLLGHVGAGIWHTMYSRTHEQLMDLEAQNAELAEKVRQMQADLLKRDGIPTPQGVPEIQNLPVFLRHITAREMVILAGLLRFDNKYLKEVRELPEYRQWNALHSETKREVASAMHDFLVLQLHRDDRLAIEVELATARTEIAKLKHKLRAATKNRVKK